MTIPMDEFGQDHWSTFAYICSCIVDQGGKLRPERMRSDPSRHLHLCDPRLDDRSCPPTRLRAGREITGHDDWDCADDLVEAGLLVLLGTGLYPLFSLTDSGWQLCREITEYRFGDSPGSFADFRPLEAGTRHAEHWPPVESCHLCREEQAQLRRAFPPGRE